MNNKNIKLYGVLLGVILFIILMAGITYAWITWRSGNINITGSSECFTINYTKGDNITQTIDDTGVILFDESTIINDNKITIKNGMAITNVVASLDSSCNITGDLTITLNISNLNNAFTSKGNSTGAFKYVIASYDPSIYTTISISELANKTFDIISTDSITSTDSIELVNKEINTTATGYLIIFYVDGDLAYNDVGESTFSGSVSAIATQTEG